MLILLCLGLLAKFVTATLPNTSQIQTFVNTHNYYRSIVSPSTSYMPPMSWSPNLALGSNNWAAQCSWSHSNTPNVGENLYATTTRTPNPANFSPVPAVNLWGGERWYYNYATNTCAAGHVCGHYTQMVWSNSVNLGCAFQDCPAISGLPWPQGGTLVVCQYSPKGNTVGMKPYCRF